MEEMKEHNKENSEAAAPAPAPAPEQPAAEAAPAPAKPKKPKTSRTQFAATGRRKVSTSRVRLLTPGKGRIMANGKPLEQYFTRETHRIVIQQPLKAAQLEGKFDIHINSVSGGMTGQAEASRHAIARAIIKYDQAMRPVLKKSGYLTRDPRVKERKKYGRKRARKRFQFSKR